MTNREPPRAGAKGCERVFRIYPSHTRARARDADNLETLSVPFAALDPTTHAHQAEARRARQRERKRRYDQRQKTGGAVLKVAITDYFQLVGLLIDNGWLREAEALDRRQVEAAVAALLADAARR